MRITGVRVVLHDRVSTGLAVFGVKDGRLPMGILRILTDEGIEGNNFISYPGPGPAAIAQEITDFIKPLLVGADPLDIGAHWRRMAGLRLRGQRARAGEPGTWRGDRLGPH